MRKILIPLFALAASLATTAPAHAAGEVNLYSYRQPFLIQPMLDEFTKQTGIAVNVVFAKKGMVEKIKAAGANNPADAVLTVDVGRLDALHQAGLLEPVDSAILDETIPAHLRHPEGFWFGLTTRARLALVSRDRVKPDELETLADLADPRFRGRICTRSGKHVYNVALIASVIANEGEGDGRAVARRRSRQSRPQAPGQRPRSGEGRLRGGVRHRDLEPLLHGEDGDEREEARAEGMWAKSVRVQFLDQNGRGNHVNISGAAVIKDAKNRANAVALLEFLTGDEAQNMYATVNFEFPVKGRHQDPPAGRVLGARSRRTPCRWKTSPAIEGPPASSWTRRGSTPGRKAESSRRRIRGSRRSLPGFASNLPSGSRSPASCRTLQITDDNRSYSWFERTYPTSWTISVSGIPGAVQSTCGTAALTFTSTVTVSSR